MAAIKWRHINFVYNSQNCSTLTCYVGAKLRGIPGGGSSSIVATNVTEVPLPPAALLFLTELAGMGLLARRRRDRLGGAAI